MEKMKVAILLMMLCVASVSSATSILWCSGSTSFDQGWVDLLTDAGYTVDRMPDAEVLTQEKVDLANTYDLVIVGRDTISDRYDDGDEVALWNSISSPLICQSGYLWRNNRWKWLDSGSTSNTSTHIAPDLQPGDALYDTLFAGVTPDENGSFSYCSSSVTLSSTSSVGNGILIGHRDYSPEPWVYVAYWETDQEFYSGSGQYAGGPRLALPAGNTNDSIRGAFNLSGSGAMIFLNSVYDMSGATFNRKPSIFGGNDRITNINEIITIDASIYDPEGSVTIAWTKISGSGTATFEDNTIEDPNVAFDTKGVYELEVTVNDGTHVVTDQVTVYVRDIADNAMIAHWDFEGLPDPNTLADVTGNGFKGTFYESESRDPNVVAGNLFGGSQAADMRSGTAYWEIPSSYSDTDPNFNDLATGMTVATWVKITDPTVAFPVLVGNGLDGWRFGINDGVYNFVFQDSKWDLRGPSCYNDRWHHYVGVFDGVGSQVLIYLDGTMAASLDVTPGTLINKGDNYPIIQIANRGDAERPWKGYIDDIRIYNYPLTSVEITGLASEGNLPVNVTAGDDQTIFFKGEPIQLEGELLTDDGYPAAATLAWSVISVPAGVDPGQVVFSDDAVEAPIVTFPNVDGTYQLRLTADDTEYTDFDDVIITLVIPTCADVIADGLGIAGDISGPADVADCRVDIYDLAAIANDWLNCNDPADAGCEWAYQQ